MEKPNMNPQMGMEMMKKMMGGSEGGSPMQMCKEMMSSIKKTTSLAAFATPELHVLFNEWLGGKEKDVLNTIAKLKKHDLADIAKALQLTPESTAYLLARMAAQGKLMLTAQPANPEKPSAPHADSTARNG